MERILNECIVACENCVADCLCSGREDMNECVRVCLMCEQICRALKTALKCNGDKNVVRCLTIACKKACLVCVAECKKHNMTCCKECVKCCSKMANCCTTKLSSKKSSKKKSSKKSKKMKGGDCGKKHY